MWLIAITKLLLCNRTLSPDRQAGRQAGRLFLIALFLFTHVVSSVKASVLVGTRSNAASGLCHGRPIISFAPCSAPFPGRNSQEICQLAVLPNVQQAKAVLKWSYMTPDQELLLCWRLRQPEMHFPSILAPPPGTEMVAEQCLHREKKLYCGAAPTEKKQPFVQSVPQQETDQTGALSLNNSVTFSVTTTLFAFMRWRQPRQTEEESQAE